MRKKPQPAQDEGLAVLALARIGQLEIERDQFVAQANQRIAAYNGAIAELKALVDPPKENAEVPK